MSKKLITLHVIAAILLLAFFIVSRMPAYIVFKQLQPYGQFLHFGNVTGTVWKGTVSDVSVRYNRINMILGYTQWQLKPWQLLLGSVGLHLKADHDKQYIEGDVQASVSGIVTVSDAEVMAPAALMTQFYPIPGQIGGDIEINITELAFDAKGLKALEASGVYQKGSYNLGELVELGTYGAKFNMEKDTIKATMNDVDAQVGMDGDASIDLANRKYELDVKLTPKKTANPLIAQSLAQFIPQETEGTFHVRRRSSF